jgi:hypothetical protein
VTKKWGGEGRGGGAVTFTKDFLRRNLTICHMRGKKGLKSPYLGYRFLEVTCTYGVSKNIYFSF